MKYPCGHEHNVSGYLEGSLSADILAQFEAHLPGCSACQATIDDLLQIPPYDPALDPDGLLEPLDEAEQTALHIEDAALLRYMDELSDEAERQEIRSHIAWCRVCENRLLEMIYHDRLGQQLRANVEPARTAPAESDGPVKPDLQSGIHHAGAGAVLRVAGPPHLPARAGGESALRKRWLNQSWAILSVAAAVVICTLLLRHPPAQRPARAGAANTVIVVNRQGVASTLPSVIAQARKTEELQPIQLASLVDVRGTAVRGDNPDFYVYSPQGTILSTDQPAFHWSKEPNAEKYVVEVHDLKNPQQALLHQDTLNTTCKANKVLPRGVILTWQVLALNADGQLFAAAPSAFQPKPLFRIQTLDEAAAYQQAASSLSSPVDKGILCSQIGLLDDAEASFLAVTNQDPDYKLSQQLLANLRAQRKLPQPSTDSTTR